MTESETQGTSATNAAEAEHSTSQPISPLFGVPATPLPTPAVLALGPSVTEEDISDPNAWRNIDSLVARLMDPPREAYYGRPPGHSVPHAVRIRLGWVKSAVGEQHFVHSPEIGRSVLKPNSKIRTHGMVAGLPAMYHGWLCGNRDAEPMRASRFTRAELYLPDHFFRKVTTLCFLIIRSMRIRNSPGDLCINLSPLVWLSAYGA